MSIPSHSTRSAKFLVNNYVKCGDNIFLCHRSNNQTFVERIFKCTNQINYWINKMPFSERKNVTERFEKIQDIR